MQGGTAYYWDGEHWEAKHTQGDKGHDEDLGSWSEENWQQHSLSRWSENVSVDQFPAKLLLSVLLEDRNNIADVDVIIDQQAEPWKDFFNVQTAISLCCHDIFLLKFSFC